MRFLGSLAVFLATAQAAVTADGLITTLNAFRDAATELQGEARKVDAKSCNSFQSGDGPLNVCVDTMHVAVEQAHEFAEKLGGSPNYCGARGDDVLGAFKGFVDAHHRLFNILAHKAGDLSVHRKQYPEAGEAVVSALTNVDGVGQAFAGFVDNHLPCKNKAVEVDTEKLSRSLGMCIRKWKKVCGKDCNQYH